MARITLTEKLNRLKSHLGENSGFKPKSKIPSRYIAFAKAIGGELITNDSGNYCLIRSVFPVGYRHGSHKITGEGLKRDLPVAAFNTTGCGVSVKPESLLFVDTETTGLGGSGTVAFLIGIGRITAVGFEVRQYLIPDYGDEAAMLSDIFEIFSDEMSVVTFNGASFDLPLLKDRLIINRVGRKLSHKHHLDLLHSSRRLFKRRLKCCTLTNLERELFEFQRQDDIPGYLVPSVFFDWLNHEDLTSMNAVIEHNRLDIVSLYFLAGLIAEAYSSHGKCLEHSEDLHSLSRWYSRRKERQSIEIVYNHSAETTGKMTPEAILFYARSFKRLSNYEECTRLLSKIVGDDSKYGFSANVELAMHYEHRTGDLHKAMEHARQAEQVKEVAAGQKMLLKKRIKRLSSKLRI